MVTPKSPLLPHLLILAPPAATTFLLFEHTDKLLVRAWDGCCLRLECFSPRHLCGFILLSASSLRSSLSLNEVILTTTGKVTTTHSSTPISPYLGLLCLISMVYSIFKFRNIRQCHITMFLSLFLILSPFLPSYLTCNGPCDYIWPALYSRIICLFKVSLPTLVVLATSVHLCHIIYSQILGIKNGHFGGQYSAYHDLYFYIIFNLH